ncbi:hypothetical protein SAMN04488109_3324 [Chryseolinea serpens]|uniref:Uncharacterized protein n=1 Tax=Chryseolinea serpens TaxID=947013 RepID=A0A1M5RDM5_9BACT|nr:hypothetical protein [Chryseolinea serpens]SHH24119.1 hypothetical protein SAMN04488109_3324 [Chryseolinea serpens]
MKHILLISFLVLTVSRGLAQEYIEIITRKSCDCGEQVPDTLKSEQFNMRLGLCMIDASMPYKKQIKKDFGIDLDKIDTEGVKLGRMLGVKMASVCPNTLLKMTQRIKGQTATTKAQQSSEGTVTKIENDFFVVLSLKDESGKITKYYWLTFIESAGDLTSSYSTLVGKTLHIDYEPQEFFDPKLQEYRQFFVVKRIIPMD